MTINEIIRNAKHELGVTEYPANSNNVKYNTWYYGKMVQGSAYPWCAVFISFIFREAPNLCKKTASCLEILEWFEQQGRIVTHPQPGDLIFFKYGTNNRRTNHVGIITSVNGTVFTTIEGNTSTKSDDNGGAVMERRRSMKNVVAFARPAYSDVNDYHPTLRKGAKGEQVELLQELLAVKGYILKVDGDFGTKTEEAVKNFQKANGLTDDGIVGPKTWEKLLK